MKAEIMLDYKEAKTAEAVAKAVSPDNSKTPMGLTIRTARKDGRVSTTIECKNGLSTFIATIDDLLFCTSIAENTLQTARKIK